MILSISVILGILGVINVFIAFIKIQKKPETKFFNGKTLRESINESRKLLPKDISMTDIGENEEKILSDFFNQTIELDKHNSTNLDSHMISLCGGGIVLILSILNSSFLNLIILNQILFPLYFSLIFFGICLISIISSYFLNSIAINRRETLGELANKILRIPKYVLEAKDIDADIYEARINSSEQIWNDYQNLGKQLENTTLYVRVNNSLSYFLFIYSAFSFLVFIFLFREII